MSQGTITTDISSRLYTNQSYRNEFEERTPQWLRNDVRQCIQENELESLGSEFEEFLAKGAEVLKWEGKLIGDGLRTEAGLSEGELIILKDEGKWRSQPWRLVLTTALNCIAAVVQGWDQSGTNGANLFWPQSLIGNCSAIATSTDSFPAPPLSQGSTSTQSCEDLSLSPCVFIYSFAANAVLTCCCSLVGLVNAAPYIMIAVV